MSHALFESIHRYYILFFLVFMKQFIIIYLKFMIKLTKQNVLNYHFMTLKFGEKITLSHAKKTMLCQIR